MKKNLQYLSIATVFACTSLPIAHAQSVIGLDDHVVSAGKKRSDFNISKETAANSENNRYVFKHAEEFYPVKTIDKVSPNPYQFKQSLQKGNIDNLSFEFTNPLTQQKSTHTIAQLLHQTRTDAFIVLKDGKLVYESYFDGQDERTRHQLMSVSKSVTGMIAASLIAEGNLDRNAKVIDYIPELKGSAYTDATVGDVMNMTVGLKYSEDYADPNSEVSIYTGVLGYTPLPASYKGEDSIRGFIPTIKKQVHADEKFDYITVNTDVVCWLSERATQKPFEELLSERVWSKMGMLRDAYMLVDHAGTVSCGGGLNATAIDMAKIGQMLLNKGQFNKQQILSEKAIEAIAQGGNQQAFARYLQGHSQHMKNWSYKDQFWVTHNSHQAYTGIGIFGQWLYIDPSSQVVIVKQSSLPQADNAEVDAYTLAGFNAIIDFLNQAKP